VSPEYQSRFGSRRCIAAICAGDGTAQIISGEMELDVSRAAHCARSAWRGWQGMLSDDSRAQYPDGLGVGTNRRAAHRPMAKTFPALAARVLEAINEMMWRHPKQPSASSRTRRRFPWCCAARPASGWKSAARHDPRQRRVERSCFWQGALSEWTPSR